MVFVGKNLPLFVLYENRPLMGEEQNSHLMPKLIGTLKHTLLVNTLTCGMKIPGNSQMVATAGGGALTSPLWVKMIIPWLPCK